MGGGGEDGAVVVRLTLDNSDIEDPISGQHIL